MFKGRRAEILLALLFGAFAFGVARLLHERYSLGDVHPPYSTLRADPLGAKALYQALAETGAVVVRRNMAPLSRLDAGPGTTLIVLGMPPIRLAHADPDFVSALESDAVHGARVVVSFAPGAPDGAIDGSPEGRDGGPHEVGGRSPEAGAPARPRTMGERWGFGVSSPALPADASGTATVTSEAAAATALPERISWHAPLCFTGLEDDWRIAYARDECPVLIERALGAGSLVLASDSYFASNEAMRREPHADLLSYLVGPALRVVFDETHHGVEERPSLAMLARRYRLGRCLLVLLVLAGLFVWRSASPLVPPVQESLAGADPMPGRESAAALVDLLRRGAPPRRVVEVCREAWIRTFGRRRPDLASALKSASSDARDPVTAYGELQRIVARMKGDHER